MTNSRDYRIIKLTQGSGQHCIEIIPEKDIEKEYNAFGSYYINEAYKESLKQYKEERREYVEGWKEESPDFSFSDLKEALEDFQDQFYHDTEGKIGEYVQGRPQKWVQFNDVEDSYFPDLSGFYDEPEGEELENDDCFDVSQYHEYWDGSNWKRRYISGQWDVFAEDITNECGDSFDQKISIGSDRDFYTSRGRWCNYYYDKEGEILFVENVTCWQGERTFWIIIENKEEIDIVFVLYAKDKIDELRPEMRKQHGESLEVLRKRDGLSFEDVPHRFADLYEIFSLNDTEELGDWVNDPCRRNCGGTYYKYGERTVQYTWSAYQGDWCGYSEVTYDDEIDVMKERLKD